ncbi:MAG: aldo/keto reductase [Acidaminococcaceae bacterium]
MLTVTLGQTGITVNKNGFGALPIQRITHSEAVQLVQQAYAQGIRYFDTARAYSDSEEKLGVALREVRHEVFLATKTVAKTGAELKADLEMSLRQLQTDYIDVYQFHNPDFIPRPGGEDGLYDAALQAQAAGKIRYLGLTNHRWHLAEEAIASRLYATLQFPFSYLASAKEFDLVEACVEADMGFIAMKGLSGGLINNAKAAYAFMAQYDNVLPIWGLQRTSELEEFVSFQAHPPVLDHELRKVIAKDQEQLVGGFCRGCGYCLPCPVGINIPLAARMSLMLRRAPVATYTTPEIQENMAKIDACLHCNHCKDHCPYGLDTPALLRANYEDFKTFLK